MRHYTNPQKAGSTYGELEAVLFALNQFEFTLPSFERVPEHVNVYSDIQAIELLLDHSRNPTESITKPITLARLSVLSKWPEMELSILFLTPNEQRQNPYYSAAHNAARREVSI